MMFKAVNQWSFAGDMTPMQCLEASAALGFAGFEPAFGEEGPLSLAGFCDDARRLRSAAQDLGVRLDTLASGVYWKYPLSSPDAGVRAQARDAILAQIDCAAELGAKTILIVPGTVGRGFFGTGAGYGEAYTRSQEILGGVEAHARQAGVVIGVENVWNNFLLSPLEFARYLDELGSPYIKAYFDVGNIVPYGEGADWIRTLGGRIGAVHVKDFRRQVGTLSGFVPLLEGDVAWGEVMNALRAAGYDGPLTAEMGVSPIDPLYAARAAASALEVILSL